MKLKHSLVYSSSSGNLGGSIVASGHNGSVLYNRTRKKRAVSNKQTQRRSAFLRIVAAWRTLDNLTLSKYNIAATEIARVNRFSGTRCFTGFQLFFYVNFQRSLLPASMLLSYPFIGAPLTIFPISFIYNKPLSSVLFNFTTAGDVSQRFFVFAQPISSLSAKLSPKSYKFLFSLYGNFVSPYNFKSIYLSVFPRGFISGSCISFKVTLSNFYGKPYYPAQYFTCLIP